MLYFWWVFSLSLHLSRSQSVCVLLFPYFCKSLESRSPPSESIMLCCFCLFFGFSFLFSYFLCFSCSFESPALIIHAAVASAQDHHIHTVCALWVLNVVFFLFFVFCFALLFVAGRNFFFYSTYISIPICGVIRCVCAFLFGCVSVRENPLSRFYM